MSSVTARLEDSRIITIDTPFAHWPPAEQAKLRQAITGAIDGFVAKARAEGLFHFDPDRSAAAEPFVGVRVQISVVTERDEVSRPT